MTTLKSNSETGFRIRPAQDDDIPAIAEIESACFSHPWSEKSLRDTLHTKEGHLFVLETDGQIAAYAGMYVLFEDADVTNVACLPAFRRNGFARALLGTLITEAKALGAERLHLEVRVSNAPALALYSSEGFQTDGKRKNYYTDPTEDAYFMTRPL